jgi:hypothetical protein
MAFSSVPQPIPEAMFPDYCRQGESGVLSLEPPEGPRGLGSLRLGKTQQCCRPGRGLQFSNLPLRGGNELAQPSRHSSNWDQHRPRRASSEAWHDGSPALGFQFRTGLKGLSRPQPRERLQQPTGLRPTLHLLEPPQ